MTTTYPTSGPTPPQHGTGDLGWAPAEPPAAMPSPPPPAPSPRPRRTVALVATTAVLAGAVGGGAGALAATLADGRTTTTVTSTTDSGTSQPVDLPTGSVAAVAKRVLPSVVSIQFTSAAGSGEGSGVILTSGGLILTNNHVVAEAANGGSLTVTFHDGSTATATIVGRDPTTDLAVVQAEGVSGLKPAALGSSSSLVVGQSVVAIGSPLGLSGTVTEGIVSALNRPVSTGGSGSSAVFDAIQTDAAINPGNSGGALVNLAGQVVGINSAIATLGSGAGGESGSIGLGFAIPIDQAKQVADQIVGNGTVKHAKLGVSVGDATGSTAGAQVGQVESGSAADKAGLRAGDVITRFDGQAIGSADALVAAIRSQSPGSTVSMTYVRSGTPSTTTVTLGSD